MSLQLPTSLQRPRDDAQDIYHFSCNSNSPFLQHHRERQLPVASRSSQANSTGTPHRPQLVRKPHTASRPPNAHQHTFLRTSRARARIIGSKARHYLSLSVPLWRAQGSNTTSPNTPRIPARTRGYTRSIFFCRTCPFFLPDFLILDRYVVRNRFRYCWLFLVSLFSLLLPGGCYVRLLWCFFLILKSGVGVAPVRRGRVHTHGKKGTEKKPCKRGRMEKVKRSEKKSKEDCWVFGLRVVCRAQSRVLCMVGGCVRAGWGAGEVRIVAFWGSGEGGAGSEQSIWRAFAEGKGSAEQGSLWIECTGRGVKGRH